MKEGDLSTVGQGAGLPVLFQICAFDAEQNMKTMRKDKYISECEIISKSPDLKLQCFLHRAYLSPSAKRSGQRCLLFLSALARGDGMACLLGP